jgi:uncharacterized membrane protein
MKTYSDYRAAARESLSGNWKTSVIVMLMIWGITILLSTVIGLLSLDSEWLGNTVNIIVSILLILPLQWAFANALLQLVRGDNNITENTKQSFKTNYRTFVLTYLLMIVILLGIGVVTLLIGTFILAYAYRMVPYLIQEYPELTPREALKLSREMMRGHKWNLFVLDLTFMGWILLTVLTLGIGGLWLTPYMQTTVAHYYEDLKQATIVEE